MKRKPPRGAKNIWQRLRGWRSWKQTPQSVKIRAVWSQPPTGEPANVQPIALAATALCVLPATNVMAGHPLDLLGDVNIDGFVNVADVSALEAALADLTGYQFFNNFTDTELFALCNINQDNYIDNTDVEPSAPI
jgi:hypothetical protein